MEIYTEGGIFPIPPERKVERIARSNAVRKPQDKYDKSNASRHREDEDTVELSQEAQAYLQAIREQKESQEDET